MKLQTLLFAVFCLLCYYRYTYGGKVASNDTKRQQLMSRRPYRTLAFTTVLFTLIAVRFLLASSNEGALSWSELLRAWHPDSIYEVLLFRVVIFIIFVDILGGWWYNFIDQCSQKDKRTVYLAVLRLLLMLKLSHTTAYRVESTLLPLLLMMYCGVYVYWLMQRYIASDLKATQSVYLRQFFVWWIVFGPATIAVCAILRNLH